MKPTVRARMHYPPPQVGSQHMLPTGRLTVFHGLRPPPIGLQAYLERVAKYTKCSPVCFIMALTYMDTLAQVAGVGVGRQG